MSLDWRVVPIEKWPGEQTKSRQQDRFGERQRGVDWTGTTRLLQRELAHLGASNILLQMAVEDRYIRQDGWIHARAVPSHPGVILTFDSKSYGPLSYPCDAFLDWRANVRAIALALEALRKVDRYGVTRRGEQYTGWKALPPAGGTSSTMTAEVASRVIADAAYRDGGQHHPYRAATLALGDPEEFRKIYRSAARRTHPDAGGSVRDFQLVQEAKGVLERHHGINGGV